MASAILKGKVAIVTGGNRGLGLETVKRLLRAGAKVYLAARNETQATEVIAQLKREDDLCGEVVYLKLDLSDPRLARKSAEEFKMKENRLDILVNNAAMLNGPYQESFEGVSDMVVTNYLSPFVFTHHLIPILSATAQQPGSDVRIVNLVSTIHTMTPSPFKIDSFKDLNVKYPKTFFAAGFLRYGHSKLLDILWTTALQRYFKANKAQIVVVAVHPGGVNTFSDRFPFFLRPLIRLVFEEPEVGALTTLFAATNVKVAQEEKYRGAYLVPIPTPGSIAPASAMARDEDSSRRLWEVTIDFIREKDLA